ncbi:Clp1-like protein [Mycena venus]|uniref:Clp1-like protein n=1 Tax=Mycena venus TaxID=2733690 RepID=A0A8H6XKI3_9AGAR|nr:Clp1-like protein [Mycena venus]
MQAGIPALAPSHLPPSIPPSYLPQALTVPLRAPPPGAPALPSCPTHALAIAPPAKSSSGERDAPQAIFPVHAVVLAAHCAKIPRLPSSPRAHSASAAVTLPVLPLALPSPQAFRSCTRSCIRTASTRPSPPSCPYLLPSSSPSAPHPRPLHPSSPPHSTPPLSGTPSPRTSAPRPVATSPALMAHAGHVKELWQDMVALGMYDLALWDALELAWEVVLGAMNLAAQ